MRREGGMCVVYSVPDHGAGDPLVRPEENELKVVYDCGPLKESPWEDFDAVRKRVDAQWKQLAPIKVRGGSENLKES